jgi:hypothetical protein
MEGVVSPGGLPGEGRYRLRLEERSSLHQTLVDSGLVFLSPLLQFIFGKINIVYFF